MIEKVVILSTSTMGEREPFLERGSITESVFHDADSARRGLLFADLFYGFCVTRRGLWTAGVSTVPAACVRVNWDNSL